MADMDPAYRAVLEVAGLAEGLATCAPTWRPDQSPTAIGGITDSATTYSWLIGVGSRSAAVAAITTVDASALYLSNPSRFSR